MRWPTELAISPLDNSLHIIDDHMILKLAPDGRVKVVAGRPLHCPSPVGGYDTELATHATLVMPQSIAFGPSGDHLITYLDKIQTFSPFQNLELKEWADKLKVSCNFSYSSAHFS